VTYGVAAAGERKIPKRVVTSRGNSIRDNIVTCISDCRRGLDWLIGFIVPYTLTQLFYTPSSSQIHTHYDSVFTSRILATELSRSHSNFKSHVKSSGHSLIPFLPFLSQSPSSAISRTRRRQSFMTRKENVH
jgi:hypothetical protein